MASNIDILSAATNPQGTGFNKKSTSHYRWRTIDIVVASVIAVAGGAVFWGWDQLWSTTSAAFAGFPPAQAVMYGVWLAPGVIGGLIIKKPLAAFYTELLASIVEALLGSQWGLSVVLYGLAQGLAPEIIFALFFYRAFRLPVAVIAGAAAGLAASSLDLYYYYSAWQGNWKATYVIIVMTSSAVIAGLLGWLLVKGLERAGALGSFSRRVKTSI
ncbi:MAG: ECF transporter S component [Firmicutes bacterium]|nr:ECF transporter S component [Bacillota bacterium]